MKRLRVLISAHECSPEQGSECAVGWNIATRMAAYHDVTVLAAAGSQFQPNSYREAISRYLDMNGRIPGLRFVFVEQPAVTIRTARVNSRLMRLTGGIGWQLLYYRGLDAWLASAFRKASELGLRNFDVVHQLTPISFRRPGHFWRSGLPFYWGPINGMYQVRPAFIGYGGPASFLFETLRNSSITLHTRSASFREAVAAARRIWTVSENEAQVVNGISPGRASLMIDAAPPTRSEGRLRTYDGNRPLRLCWSGSHEPFKALPLLLHALARLPERRHVILDVLGDGRETARWRALAESLRLNTVTWHGRLSYDDALATMGTADMLVHTSLREAASMAVLEALGAGMPVVCHDICGMAVAVDHSCGVKVPLVDPERSIRGFRDAIGRFLRTPKQVTGLSAGALRRAQELSWDAKVREIALAYHDGRQAAPMNEVTAQRPAEALVS